MVVHDRTRIVLRCMRCGEGSPCLPRLNRDHHGQKVLSLLQLGRRGAERRFGEMINELGSLTSLPHLGDMFDSDGLPLSFIIKRDARDASGRRPEDTGPVRRR